MSNTGTFENPSSWLRWTHEYMFSLNLSWIIVWMERVKSKALGGPFEDKVMSWASRAYQLASPIGGRTILDQLVWSLLFGTIVFFLLRSLSRLPVSNFALRAIAGAVAIGAFPIASLFFGLTYPACCGGAYRIVMSLEVLIALICGALFYARKRRISSLLMILILFLHFSIWTFATSSYINPVAFVSALRSSEYYHPWTRTIGSLSLAMVFHFGSPVFGFLAALTWVPYLAQTSKSYNPGAPNAYVSASYPK